MYKIFTIKNGIRERSALKSPHVKSLVAALLFISFLHISATVQAQKVTLSEKNASLKKTLDDIKHQTGYTALFSRKIMASSRPVNIQVTAMPLKQALDQIFQAQPIHYSIEDKTIILKEIEAQTTTTEVSPVAIGATITVSSKVTDDAGKPLYGATIKVKGTETSTATNMNGDFKLAGVDNQSTLVITFVGFQPLEAKAVPNMGTIKLGVASGSLNEVKIVNTAYGVERNIKELGYSIDQVSGESINHANSGSLLTGLIGKVPGLNITTESTDMNPQMRVLLRGIRSFGQNANSTPLFIFNGSPISFGSDQNAASLVMDFLNNLNPADIENVTVIKGVNGAALYGPEGSNGVILINTKKGIKGKNTINFRNVTSIGILDQRYSHPYQTEFGAGTAPAGSSISISLPSQTLQAWGPAYNGQLTTIGYPDQNGNYQKIPYKYGDGNRNFFNRAITNRTNVSFSAGDDVSTFYFGAGRTDQTSVIPGDHQNQTTVNLNGSRKIGVITLQVNLNYAHGYNNQVANDVVPFVRTTPAFIDLTAYKNLNDHWSNLDNYFSAGSLNPYQAIQDDRGIKSTNTIAGNVALIAKPLKWLTITERPGINYSGSTSQAKIAPEYFDAYARVNPFKLNDVQPALTVTDQTAYSFNNDVLVQTLNRSGDFMYRTTFGSTLRQNYETGLQSQAILTVPVYNLIYARSAIIPTETEFLTRLISGFFSGSIGYQDKYFLELTARNEWDSKVAVAARGKDAYFGANASVIIKEAVPFLKSLDWLSTAGLRMSLASSANMDIAPYESSQYYSLNTGYPLPSGVVSYSETGGVPNPNLQPEKVISQEYGANIGLFKDRLLFDFSYYYQVNNTVILGVVNPWLSGAPSIDNVGRFQNHGFELSMKLNPLVRISSDTYFTLEANVSSNDNKVLQLSPVYHGLFPTPDPVSGQTLYAQVGGSAFQYGLTDFNRDPQGRVIVDAVTGLPTVDQTKKNVIGRTSPKYTSSMNLEFVWKRFTVSALLDYSGDYNHYQDVTALIQNGQSPLTTYNNREPFVWPNSVYKDASGNYVPNKTVIASGSPAGIYGTVSQASVLGFYNATNLKLRELALLYEMPVKSKMIHSISGSIWARDVLSWYPKSNINGDPGQVNGPGYHATPPVSNNLAGSTSAIDALPGIAQFGFTLSANF